MNLKGTNACLAPHLTKVGEPWDCPLPHPRLPSPQLHPSAPSSFGNSVSLPRTLFPPPPHLGPEDWRGKCSERRKFGDRRVGLQVLGGRGNAPEARVAVVGGPLLAQLPAPGPAPPEAAPRAPSRRAVSGPRGGERRAGARRAGRAFFPRAGLGRFTWRPQPQ